MEIKIYSGSEIETIKNDWNELHSKDKHAIFYNSYSFVSIWIKHSVDPSLIQIITVKEGNTILGLCTLLKSNSGPRYLKKEMISFIGGIEFGDILIDNSFSAKQTIVKHLFKGILSVVDSRICLTKIPDNSLLLSYLLKTHDYNKNCVSRIEVPYVDLNKWNDFDNYKNKCLSKKLVKRRKKFSKEKDYEFSCLSGTEIPFDEIVELHQNRANDANRGGSVFDSKFDLYKELVSLDESYCFLIRVNGLIVGYRLAFLSNGVLYSWNTAHSPQYDIYSIGQVLIYDTIEYSYNNIDDVDKYDLGGGRYSWKFELTPDFRTIYEFRLNTKHTKLFNFVDSLEYGLRGFFKK
ncbi:CelD/BcsL family acetyltransferase involved in cellulose biosynthesis [Ancylomarina subtilis]|uniref:CelD/BcsL family acetyltransferase involved in cellulose biosynthesis n=1 Tax=Ancylomarina subtilis TaxID=1639035 RepID=A0A4Q7VJX1_9BACT|nr:GNAT family N-acetyltransferase [Ancylomarina subtilis]RZT96493.1 CelD/BcsL family acetyltransferase involved in cellulose biosynthesis [Ancylomarina subtilis]